VAVVGVIVFVGAAEGVSVVGAPVVGVDVVGALVAVAHTVKFSVMLNRGAEGEKVLAHGLQRGKLGSPQRAQNESHAITFRVSQPTKFCVKTDLLPSSAAMKLVMMVTLAVEVKFRVPEKLGVRASIPPMSLTFLVSIVKDWEKLAAPANILAIVVTWLVLRLTGWLNAGVPANMPLISVTESV